MMTLIFAGATLSSAKSKWSLVEVEVKEERKEVKDEDEEGQEKNDVDAEEGIDYRKVIEYYWDASTNKQKPF